MPDWEKIDSMADEDIDFSDVPELDETFFKNAKIVLPKPKVPVTFYTQALSALTIDDFIPSCKVYDAGGGSMVSIITVDMGTPIYAPKCHCNEE
jgi:hypothetical protein